MQDMIDHIKEVLKTILGGGAVAGGTHVVFDLVQATQYASLAAGTMTTIYFFVATIIAIKNRNKSPNP